MKCSHTKLTDQSCGDPEDLLDMLGLGPAIPVPEPLVTVRELDAYAVAPYALLSDADLRGVLQRLCTRIVENGPYTFLDSVALTFNGNGVYAVYYQGELELYRPIRSLGSTCPIYIGRACQTSISNALSVRLREHLTSLERTDLGVENFTFRFVVLPDNYVEFAEANLIALLQPLWNGYLRGFGEREGNRRSSRRAEQLISRWDTLHAGRVTGSDRRRDRETVESEAQEHVRRCRARYEHVLRDLLDGLFTTPRTGR